MPNLEDDLMKAVAENSPATAAAVRAALARQEPAPAVEPEAMPETDSEAGHE